MSIEIIPSQVRPTTADCPVPVAPVAMTSPTNPEDTLGRELETLWDENVRQIKDLLSQGQYKEAVLFGGKVSHEFRTTPENANAYTTTAQAEFDVHFAKALFYTGRTEEAIRVLQGIIAKGERGRDPWQVAWQSDPSTSEGRRRNRVLGLTHNHLGYVYWMNQGHYRLALRESCTASSYFYASGLVEEYANTSDNRGRVYALLYQRDQSERLIDEGLDLRLEFGSDDRVALSLNSRAIAHLIFAEPRQAQRLSTEALSIFERLGAQRGIGLASITLGRVLRCFGGSDNIPHEKRITSLEQAAMYLGRAIEIFHNHVYEPVRSIEAHNELGCTYRDWADLIRRMDPDSEQVGHYNDIAVQHLRKAIKLAEKENIMLLCVDSCEDLARTYLQNGQFDAAERWLQYAEGIIPNEYKSREGSGLRDVPIEECVEGFWYQMGKIELSRGHLAFKRGTSDNGGVPHEALKQTTQHRASAIAYFDHHKTQAAEARTYFPADLQPFSVRPSGRHPLCANKVPV